MQPSALPSSELVLKSPTPENRSHSIAIQTDFREEGTQTMPWAPDVRNKDSHPNMEILHLKGTDDFQEGINRLNKIREDEAFEKTLPGLQSLCELELRKALIKKRETLNWKQRDQQLENHFLKNWESFVDRLISKEAARDAKIQRRTMDRYKTLQSKEIPKEKRIGPVHDLQTQRWLEPPPSKKFSHIDGFVDIHSSFYCPMKRNGRFLRFLPPFPVFNDNFDASLFEKKISKFWDRCLPTKKETRGERQILRDLDKIWNEIQRDKQEGREYSESWICPGFHPLQAPTHRLSPSKTSETAPIPTRALEEDCGDGEIEELRRWVKGKLIGNYMHSKINQLET